VANAKRTNFPFQVFSDEADNDYLLSRMIHFLGGGFHSRAGFFAQQACEKYMKALMVQETKSYIPTHKLLELAEACAPLDAFYADPRTIRVLKNFDYFDQVGRYGTAATYDPLAVDTEELKTAGVCIWMSSYLDDLDGFIFKTRGKLDFERARYHNSLKAIIERNRRSLIADAWKGKQPIRVVLTKQNRYYRG
jgi:HEPN domain-containing protein